MVEHRWARPQWHATIDSTNRAVHDDPVPGTVIVAEHQSAGRGRRGRTWTAPAGTALAVSVAVRPPPPEQMGWVPLVAGLAVANALAEHPLGVRAQVKWPNDVLVTGPGEAEPRKVAGILAMATPEVVILGAGLNIDQRRDQLPTAQATSWALARNAPLPRHVRRTWLQAYLDHLSVLLSSLEAGEHDVKSEYRRQCCTIGARVTVALPDGTSAMGTAQGVTDQGALVVRTATQDRVFHAGDVVHLRPAVPPG